MEAPDQRRCRFRELLIDSSLILLALWIPPLHLTAEQAAHWSWLHGLIKHPKPDVHLWRLGEQLIFPAVGIFILYCLWREKRDWKAAGLTLQNYGKAIKLLAGPTLLGVAILVAIGASMHSLDLGTDRFW